MRRCRHGGLTAVSRRPCGSSAGSSPGRRVRTMRAKSVLWRGRRNAVRRRSDAVEAWLVLVGAVLIAVGAPLAGAVAAGATEGIVQQHARGSHPTPAMLTQDASAIAIADPTGVNVTHVRAVVRWTAPD